jgi:hypothetical protein
MCTVLVKVYFINLKMAMVSPSRWPLSRHQDGGCLAVAFLVVLNSRLSVTVCALWESETINKCN